MSARTLDRARLQSLRAEALERWLVCTGWRREFHDPAEFSQYIKYDREPHAPDDEPEPGVTGVLVEDSSDGAVWLLAGGRHGVVLVHEDTGTRERAPYLVVSQRTAMG